MKRSICLIFSAAMLALIPSCSLLGSILKIPVSILKTAGRTAGVSSLTDDKPQPEKKVDEEADTAPQTAE